MLISKLKLLFAFYKGSLFIVGTIALLSLLFTPQSILFALPFVAVFCYLLYVESLKKELYFFYYNKHIAKWQLYCFCIVLNFFVAVVLLITHHALT